MADTTISYEVIADTRLAAIDAAAALLRSGVKLNGVLRCEETAPGLWKVTLHVFEDI